MTVAGSVLAPAGLSNGFAGGYAMNETFGTRLRLQREEQQIPLATIAEQTKIKLSLLEGLERDDVGRWPTGLFRRSYFRAYASAIGLDPDRMLREFQRLYPDPDHEEDVTQALAQARHINGYPTQRPPTRLRFLIDSAVSALPSLHLPPAAKNGSRVEKTVVPQPPELPAAQVAQTPTPVIQGTQVEHTPAPVIHETQVEQTPAPLIHETQVAQTVVAATPVIHERRDVDLLEVAHLCTRLGCALEVSDITPVLEDAARLLRAVGLIVWVRDGLGRVLTPVFVHGYSSELAAQIARVSHDSDNAIAVAFRTAEARIVEGSDVETGAVVVPLLTPTGCAGVLALELRQGGERLECVRAAATILAAQLSTLLGAPALEHAVTA